MTNPGDIGPGGYAGGADPNWPGPSAPGPGAYGAPGPGGYGAPGGPGPYAYPQPPAGYFAPPIPPGMYFDPASGLMLPEGTALAGHGRRIGAWFLSIVLAIVTLGIGYIIWGLIIWGRGQTPTYQVLGMRVWRPETGRVAGWWWMALREIVGRIAEGIVGLITQLVSLILFLTTRERRALHDMIAGSVVLHDPNKVLG